MRSTRHSPPVLVATAAALSLTATLIGAPSPLPRFSWIFDGDVTSVTETNGQTFVGGWFSHVAPASGYLGHLVTLSPQTGARVPTAPPLADGIVTSIAPDSDGGYYLAGRFTTFGSGPIDPFENTRLAHVRADGTVDPGFAPAVSGPIASIAFAGPVVIVMGHVSSGSHRALLVLDAVTGALQPWTPVLPGANPRAFHAVATEGVVYALWADGSTAYLTAFDGGNGFVEWTTALLGPAPFEAPFENLASRQGTNRVSGALVVLGTRVVVGLDRLEAIDRATGALDGAWGPGVPTNATIWALRVHGSRLYAAGEFDNWGSMQPRQNLAAFDVNTGGLLPWAPQASWGIWRFGGLSLEVSTDGVVFVGTPYFLDYSLNGVPSVGVGAIDAAGTSTGWTSEAHFLEVTTMAMTHAGVLVVASSVATTGGALRTNLAAFDSTSGALLPATFTEANGLDGRVADLAATGSTLFISKVAGSTASVWAATVDGRGVPALVRTGEGPPFTFGPADPDWLYLHQGRSPSTRHRLATWAPDDAWPGTHHIVATSPVLIGEGPEGLAALDSHTGAALKIDAPTLDVRTTETDGDTLYRMLPSNVHPLHSNLDAISLPSGQAVTAPLIGANLRGMVVADGRFFFSGGFIDTPAGTRFGLIETDRRGVPTAWDSGFRSHAGPIPFGQVSLLRRLGARLAAVGALDWRTAKLSVFDLSGPSAPSALRARPLGATMEFSWDGVTSPSPSTYVIEAGPAAGTTTVTVPMGSATAVTVPGPIPGRLFVRVRDVRTAEVSNEIVTGCAPLPPTNLAATLAWGPRVVLSWQAPPDTVSTYTLIAGTTSNGQEIGTITVPGLQTSFGTPVPPGEYFVRVRATNVCGTSADSGEVFFRVGAGALGPRAPEWLQARVIGSTLELRWQLQSLNEAAEYQVEVGRSPGLADLITLRIPRVEVTEGYLSWATFTAQGVPPGRYYLRVRAVNGVGAGPPSDDAVAVVR